MVAPLNRGPQGWALVPRAVKASPGHMPVQGAPQRIPEGLTNHLDGDRQSEEEITATGNIAPVDKLLRLSRVWT